MKKKVTMLLTLVCIMFLVIFSYNIKVSAMDVYVTISIGTNSTIEVEPTDPISILKGKIQDKWNIPPTTQVLVYNGTVLDDFKNISDYNIQNNETIYLQFADPADAPIFTNDSSVEKIYTIGDAATGLSAEATVTDGGTVTYQWYSNTTNSTVGGTAIAGETLNSFTPKTDTVSTNYYYAAVTNSTTEYNKTLVNTGVYKVVVNSQINKISNAESTVKKAVPTGEKPIVLGAVIFIILSAATIIGLVNKKKYIR